MRGVSVIALCVALVAAASVGRSQTSDSGESYLSRGSSLLQAGDYPHAREQFVAAIERNPRTVQGRVLLGICEFQLGKYNDAASALQEALRLDPNSEAAHYNLALAWVRLQKIDEGISELQKVLAQNPKMSAARFNLGVLLMQKSRFREAAANLELVAEDRPGDPAISLALIQAWLKSGNDARALSVAERLVSEDSRGNLSARLGIVLQESGHYSEAAHALEKARSLTTDSPEVTMALARAYLAANRSQEALAILVPLRSSRPSWEADYLLGLAYSETSRSSAAEVLREAARLKPDEAQVHYGLGSLLLKSDNAKEQEEGAAEIRESIRLAPGAGNYYVALSKWLLGRSDYKEAARVLKQAMAQVEQPTAELYVLAAIAEAELHGGEAAKPLVEKALQLDPRFSQAHYVLGNVYLRTGDYENASRAFLEAAMLDPRNDLYAHNAAVALERANRVAEAASYAEKCVQLKPGQGFYHYALGKLYVKLGKPADAIRELEIAVHIEPKIDYAYYLLARTYLRMGDEAKAQEWNRKLQEIKRTKDGIAGLAGPATESYKTPVPRPN